MGAVGIVSQLLLKYSSSDKDETNEQALCLYTSACEEDPELKSFGSSLEQQFSKLKSSLAITGGKTEPLKSVKSVCGFLVEMNQNLAKEITDNKDVLKDEELRSLVDLYYESSTKTLDLFNTVGNCANKAKLSIVITRTAIQQFEKESKDAEDSGGNKKKYEDTLEELNKVKAMGDPFGDEYKNQMKSVHDEQIILLEKVHELALKLDSKKKILKRRRRLVTIVYATAAMSFVAVQICLCVVIPPLGPYVALAAGIGLSYVIGTVGVMVHAVLKNREKDLDRQKEVVNKVEDITKVNIQGTNTINSLVDKLINSLSLILLSVEGAVVKREEEAVKLRMEAIRDEVDTFATAVKEVSEAVATCSTCVASGKLQVLEHVTNSMSSKGKKLHVLERITNKMSSKGKKK
ncbi:UPF0496 protein At5g66660-like [Brassica napus]|uniref:(rape) hypothetical protein n=1 Tax=Brassica napus TaxID=3708 RepID=A0A816Z319_BRANA|nr:UPF0496 protein At5g66660-like [Brassica napus]CAF2191621.1 unnamed protein product [Brassica napus]